MFTKYVYIENNCFPFTFRSKSQVMKNSLFLFLSACLLSIPIFSQTCLSEGITFSTQSDIDNFATNYPGCIEILGNTSITGAGISDLSGLSQLKKLKQLDISNCNNLSDFTGLENIDEIKGRLSILSTNGVNSMNGFTSLEKISGQVIISLNNGMLSLDGLQNLKQIGSFIQVSDNQNMQNLEGIGNLEVLTGSFTVYNNANMTSLVNFPKITNIGGSFQVNNNAKLTEINGFQNLEFIIGRIKVFDNPELVSVKGFNKLFAIGTELLIYNNAKLNDLNGLKALENINGPLEIYSNSSLTSLNGLENLDHTKILDLRIENSPALSGCNVESICSYLEAGGSHSISGNANGCKSKAEVIAACNGTSSINESQAENLNIFPNPFTDQIFLHTDKNITSLELLNVSGMRVYYSKDKNIKNIPADGLLPGIYFVKCTTPEGQIIEKVYKAAN